MAAMGAQEQEYAGLARMAKIQTKLTGLLAEKVTAARISEQAQVRSIHGSIDLAALPKQPSSKRPLKFPLLGLLGGLGLGVATAGLREHASQVIETEQQVAAASGLPVLGSIPIAQPQPGAPAAAKTEPRDLRGHARAPLAAGRLLPCDPDRHRLSQSRPRPSDQDTARHQPEPRTTASRRCS